MRLPDVYSRMHAAGKSSTLGVVSLMLAAFLYFIPEGIINAKILLAILFIFMTAPLSALMITRSAYRIGVPLEKNSVQDDLKDRKSTRLNSSHVAISYAVFCLKKKRNKLYTTVS